MLKIKYALDRIVVYLKGRMDIVLSTEIDKELGEIIRKENPKILILNLKDVEYMSSSGLRVMITTSRALTKIDGLLRLCDLTPSVKKVFDVVELTSMFEIYDQEEEALKA